MKLNNKIAAFTLTEIMVVLVLSTIVTGLAFSILNIVQKNMRQIESNYSYQTQLQSLELALTLDFNKYPKAHLEMKDSILVLSSPIEKKQYLFTKDSIITSDQTYNVAYKKAIFYFKGDRVFEGIVDGLQLTFNKTSDDYSIFVFKHTDPGTYFDYGHKN
ncbi:type II secretion system protein J [Aquimarina sp. W85]|uniref:PulJ/GspJ family protein n=1 Tax=Aquimarina rhodophyticola TaxID=3342246 RepID=UPI00366C51AB